MQDSQSGDTSMETEPLQAICIDSFDWLMAFVSTAPIG